MKQPPRFTLMALILAAAPSFISTAPAQYSSAVLADGPSAYYRLGEGSAASVPDTSGNGNDATVSGPVVFGQPASASFPALGTSALFNGTDTYVSPPDAPFGAAGTNPYSLSIEAWFNTTTSGVILGQNGGGTSPGTSGGGPQPGGWVPAVYIDINGILHTEVFWHGLVSPINSGSAVNNGNWHQVVSVFDGATGNQHLYLDGALVNTIGGRSQADYSPGNYDFWIGTGYNNGWPAGNNGWHYFNGSLDEVSIYPTALTAADVSEHFAAAAVPEPMSVALLGTGALVLGGWRRFRRVA